MTKPKYWKQAKVFLSKKDKVLKKLIIKYKGSLKTRKDPFFIMQIHSRQQISFRPLTLFGINLRIKQKNYSKI